MHAVDSNHGALDTTEPGFPPVPADAAPAPLPLWSQVCVRGFVKGPAAAGRRAVDEGQVNTADAVASAGGGR